MKTVAFITIKLNSERLPNKNILQLGDKPLCSYVTDTLLRCKNIDEIYIYCSEERVMNYMPKDKRLIFRQREKWLDGSLIRAQDTYTAFTNEVDADIYLAALTTAPFVKAESFDRAIEAMKEDGYDSAFAAQKLQTFAWYDGKPINYDPQIIPRTQDMKPVYIETSGFFAFKKELWKKHKRRVGFNPYMHIVDNVEAVDIDTKEDFEFAKKIIDII